MYYFCITIAFIVINLNIINIGMSTMASLCSLIWAIGTYIKAMHKINPNHNNESWISLMLQYLWRGGMLTSRLTVLVLIAICLRKWFSLFLGEFIYINLKFYNKFILLDLCFREIINISYF